MLITCSTVLSLFYEGTPKYAEDRGFTRAHASFKNGENCSFVFQRLYLLDSYMVLYKHACISNPCEREESFKLCFAPVVQSIRKLGYVIECRKVSLLKMFLLK